MGCFSWIAQDDGSQIVNDQRKTVYMVDPRDGTAYAEKCYHGYGVFGGRDYYELFADINFDLLKKQVVHRPEQQAIYSKKWTELTEDELEEKRTHGLIAWFDAPVSGRVFPTTSEYNEFFSKVKYPILVRDLKKWKNFIGKAPEDDCDYGIKRVD